MKSECVNFYCSKATAFCVDTTNVVIRHLCRSTGVSLPVFEHYTDGSDSKLLLFSTMVVMLQFLITMNCFGWEISYRVFDIVKM